MRGHRDAWSPWVFPRSKLKMWLCADDTHLMVDDGGGVISSWADRISGLTFAATLTARPTRSATGINGYPAMMCNELSWMTNTAFSTVLPVAATSGGIAVLAANYSIDALNHQPFCYGSTTERRSTFVGATAGAILAAVDPNNAGIFVSNIINAGIFASVGEWAAGAQTIYSNGQDGGGSTVAFNTGTTRAAIGGRNTSAGTNPWLGPIRHIIAYSGTLTAAEKYLLMWWMLDDIDQAFEVLPSGTPFRAAAPPVLNFTTNVAALDAQMVASAGQPTPNSSPPMVDPPIVTFSTSASLPAGFTKQATWTATPGLLRWSGGWDMTVGGVYHSSPAGYLGIIGGVNFLVGTCQRLELEVTALKVAFHVLFSNQRWRVIVDGLVITADGQATTDDDRWIILDFTGHGGSATRTFILEGDSSNSIAGVAVPTAGRVALTSALPTIRTLFVLGDSFTNSTGATYRWLGYVPQLSDYLGFRRFIADGVVGSGWLSTANVALANALDRINDVTDRDVTFRNALGATGLSKSDCVLIALGVNDPPYTKQQIQDCANSVLDQIHAIIPGVPICVTGPWNVQAPLPYQTSVALVDDGIQLACAGRPYVAYLDIEAMAFAQVGGGNIHPTDAGHATIAATLAPLIAAAVAAM